MIADLGKIPLGSRVARNTQTRQLLIPARPVVAIEVVQTRLFGKVGEREALGRKAAPVDAAIIGIIDQVTLAS